VPYWTLVRFGRWQEMLQEPEPKAASPYLRGAWHYARGQALLATGDADGATRELAALEALLPDKSLDQPLFSPNTGRAILSIAPAVLGGEIAAARGDYASAIAKLEGAIRLEDALVYTEPSEWQSPPRLALGAVGCLQDIGHAGGQDPPDA